MSSDIAIRVTNLSKCYQIYDSPRDRLKQFFVPRLQRLFGQTPKQYFREFWAIKDVSFVINKGETVGIIGRNGSGKSTLLQIICGTLSPTSGCVETNGRIAALLELGSGFNPEFTGRENVYMNAALLGLTTAEIDARFADIVSFADIGEFIEQPVKTYSSGMFVRLAFSVVVHVEPEILVVDEALSVGDAFFQSKCVSIMKTLIKNGTTILFVSHDVQAIKAMCDRAALIENGAIVVIGDTSSVVEAYYSKLVSASANHNEPAEKLHLQSLSGSGLIGDLSVFEEKSKYQRIQNGRAHFINVRLLDDKGRDTACVEFKQTVTLRMILVADSNIDELVMAYHIRDMKGVELVYSDTGVEKNSHIKELKKGQRYAVDWTFQASLREGEYNFSCMASIPRDLTVGAVDVCDFIPFAHQFRVVRGDSLPIYGAIHWDNALIVKKIDSLPS